MKRIKTAGVLILCLLLAAIFTLTALAEADASLKEEVVYVMTDASGKVNSVDVVNIFYGGDIVDYGNYSEVKMLTTEDEIHQNGDRITFSSDAQTVYYQGTLKNAEIPWNISIRYFLDGKEYAPDKIGGKSGDLEIKFSITKNEKFEGRFYENYALQAEFSLDTKRCKDIYATEGATLANEGTNKLITYTILPGNGVDSSIHAKVKNFRMDAVEINGIRLNIALGNIDTSAIDGQIGQLIAATKALYAGSTALYNGSNQLKTGSKTLSDATEQFGTGVKTLDNGVVQLQKGMLEANTGVATLNSKSAELVNGSGQVKSALSQIDDKLSRVTFNTNDVNKMSSNAAAISSTLNSISSKCSSIAGSVGSVSSSAQAGLNALSSSISALQQAASVCYDEGTRAQINQQIANLRSAYTQLSNSASAIGNVSSQLSNLGYAASGLNSQFAQINTGISQLGSFAGEFATLKSAIGTLNAKYTELDNGLTAYADGVSQASKGFKDLNSGVSQLAAGSKELLNNTGSLTLGSRNLYNGVIDLCEGTSQLNKGTGTLASEASNVNPQDQINAILASIGGDQKNPVSFVSAKNENIHSVQFVMKTDAVEPVYDDVQQDDGKKKLSWWKRLLKLFGFYK